MLVFGRRSLLLVVVICGFMDVGGCELVIVCLSVVVCCLLILACCLLFVVCSC